MTTSQKALPACQIYVTLATWTHKDAKRVTYNDLEVCVCLQKRVQFDLFRLDSGEEAAYTLRPRCLSDGILSCVTKEEM